VKYDVAEGEGEEWKERGRTAYLIHEDYVFIATFRPQSPPTAAFDLENLKMNIQSRPYAIYSRISHCNGDEMQRIHLPHAHIGKEGSIGGET